MTTLGWLWLIPVLLVLALLFKHGKFKIVGGIVVAFLVLWIFRACSDDNKKDKDNTTQKQPAGEQTRRMQPPEMNDPLDVLGVGPQSGGSNPALVLKVDCFTPCSDPLPYYFELDTQGDSIYLNYPLVSSYGKGRVFYSGKGQFSMPPRGVGDVEFVSADPRKQARVRAWQVINLNRR